MSYICEICEITFSKSCNLIRHKRQFHHDEIVSDKKLKSYEDSDDSKYSDRKEDSGRVIDSDSEESLSDGKDCGNDVLSKDTMKILENTIISAQTNVICITKRQIRDIIYKKEGYETESEDEEDFEMDDNEICNNDGNDNDNDDVDVDLESEALSLLRHIIRASSKGILKLSIKILDKILDNLSPLNLE